MTSIEPNASSAKSITYSRKAFKVLGKQFTIVLHEYSPAGPVTTAGPAYQRVNGAIASMPIQDEEEVNFEKYSIKKLDSSHIELIPLSAPTSVWKGMYRRFP